MTFELRLQGGPTGQCFIDVSSIAFYLVAAVFQAFEPPTAAASVVNGRQRVHLPLTSLDMNCQPIKAVFLSFKTSNLSILDVQFLLTTRTTF